MYRAVTRSTGRLIATAAAILFATAALSGCVAEGDTAPAPAPTAAGDTSAAEAAVAAGYEGNAHNPPDSGPAPATGKDVWILSAFQQIYGIARLAEEVQSAGDVLGWETTVCDGQNNVNGGWGACVRQATAAGADAVILISIDCAPVKAPLEEARAAGVAVASLTSFDCDDPTQGGSDPLFDATVQFVDGAEDAADFFETMGRLRADWIIAQTGGDARVLQVKFDGVAFGEYLSKGFEEQLATCSGCDIVSSVSITPADMATIRQKFETALLQATDANAVSVDVDFMFSAGIQQALATAGRADLVVAGGECGIENLGYIASGTGQQMCIGQSLGHLAWASVDQLDRFLVGAEQQVQGVGWQIVDADHNLPPAGEEYDGIIDYRSAYRALWES